MMVTLSRRPRVSERSLAEGPRGLSFPLSTPLVDKCRKHPLGQPTSYTVIPICPATVMPCHRCIHRHLPNSP